MTFFRKLGNKLDIFEEGLSLEKMPLLYWPVGSLKCIFLTNGRWRGQLTVGGATAGLVVMGAII